MIKVGVIGGTGYTAGELLRILVHHPEVEIQTIVSQSQAGNSVAEVHQDLAPYLDKKLDEKISGEEDVVFLCLGHGLSKGYIKENPILLKKKIVDLSRDFRDESEDFVYGLPEINKEKIQKAQYIANPGCFATAILLSLLPLAKNNLLKKTVNISGITGSTGAGGKLSPTSHFTWRNNNISLYKAFKHQHLIEIKHLIHQQQDFQEAIFFLPYRGNFTRGILVSAYTECDLSEEKLREVYQEFYKEALFTHLTKQEIAVKSVVNTNQGLVHISTYENQLLISTAIDNLLKGASGQAVQNMNLMLGFEEDLALRLKASTF